MKYVFLFLLFSAIGCSVSLAQEIKDQAWTIKEKKLPIPEAASTEFQALLANGSAPNLEQSKQFRIQGEEAWNTFISASNDGLKNVVDILKKQFSVSIKNEEIAGVKVQYVSPQQVAPEHADHLFILVHGGAYVIGGGDAGLWEAILIAARAKIPVLSIDYRMPPKYPFPAALDDVSKVYQEILKEYEPNKIGLGGSSAGGGLALASIHKFKELDIELPGAIFAGTPWSDLGKIGDSQYTNEGIDHILVSYDSWLEDAALLYAGEYEFKNPLISPIYGDFSDFPPTYIVTGTRDLFLSDAVRTHRKLKLAGIIAELNVYEGLSHADYMIAFNSPESVQAYEELGDFLAEHLR